MKKIVNISSYVVLFILFISLLPYVVLCYFNHPTADDFCNFNQYKNISLIDVLYTTYFNWTGRYTQVIFIYIANLLGLVTTSKITPFFLLCGLYYSVYKLLSVKFCFSKFIYRHILALLVVFIYLASMPMLSQGVYWLAATSAYLFSCILINFLFYYLEIFNKEQVLTKIKFFTFLVVIVLIMGTNENTLLFVLGMTVLNFFYFLIRMKRFSLQRLIVVIVALVSALVSILAPGNFVRLNIENSSTVKKLPILQACRLSFIHPFELISNNFMWMIMLIITIIMFLLLTNKSNVDINKAKIKLNIYYTIGLLFTTAIMAFPAYWSIGVCYTRSSNVIYWILILLIVFLSADIHILWIDKFLNKKKLCKPILIIMSFCSSVGLIYSNSNWKLVCRDIIKGKAKQYNHALNKRYNSAIKGKDMVVPPLYAIPYSLFVGVEIENFSNYWANDCLATFLEVKSIKIDKNIKQ